MPWRRQKICCHYFFHFCILRPFLLINHLHLWRGKDNPSRTASCLYHQFKCGTNSSVSCRALEVKVFVPRVGLISKCFGRHLSLKLSQLDSIEWVPWQQKKLQYDVIGWLKYFAVYNPQLCLRVNVKLPHSRVIRKIFVLRIALITIHGEASHVSVFGRHKHKLIRGVDYLCLECGLQLLVPYFQNDFDDTRLESCHYWVQIKSPT